MDPPGFVLSTLDREGLNQPCCRECLRSATARYSMKVICLRYDMEVGLYSVCDSFQRRVAATPPFINWECADPPSHPMEQAEARSSIQENLQHESALGGTA